MIPSMRLREEENRLKKVEEWLIKVEKEGTMPEYDVVFKKVEALNVASVRGVIPSYQDISRFTKNYFPIWEGKESNLRGRPMAIYHDSEYKEKDPDVEAAVPVSET